MPEDQTSFDSECFFIAPIGKEGSPERNRSDGILDFIVSRAAQELGLTAIRADHMGEPGQITLQVINHILGAKAAVADLTGLNPNVFYELAVRHTARLPVALIAEKDCKLPFDIAQMRTIFFDHTDLRSADLCRQAIVTQLREAFNGAVDSPIATSVDVRNLQGGTAVERNVAELVTTMEQIASTQRHDSITIRRMMHVLERTLERRGESTVPIRALRSAFIGLRRLHAVIDERDDEELVQALAGIEDPMEYIAQRVDLKVPLPTFKESTSSSQSPIRIAPEPTMEDAGKKTEEDAAMASDL